MALGFLKRVFSSVWMEVELISWGLEGFGDLVFFFGNSYEIIVVR